MEWIKCSEKMPEPTPYGGKRLCIVHAFETNVSGERMPYNSYDWFDDDENEWDNHTREEVTHWIYAQDIPFPQSE